MVELSADVEQSGFGFIPLHRFPQTAPDKERWPIAGQRPELFLESTLKI